MTNPERIYYVYMMQSASRRALYIGVTSKIEVRVSQHKNHRFSGFSDEYNTSRLVYFERFGDIRSAIEREKQLKGWRREKKDRLIDARNPTRRDLSEEWFAPPRFSQIVQAEEKQTQGPSTPLRSARDDVPK